MSLASTAEVDRNLPTTWCVVSCNDCPETWTVDTAEHTPPLTTHQVERILWPLLESHATAEHGSGW